MCFNKEKNKYNLLDHCNVGGCSAKLPPNLLESLIQDYGVINGPKELIVGMEEHDDAAVWKIADDKAIISTTDFFPPVCADPFEFGEIAATNALSDVYAMGGTALLALNLVMFPSATMDLAILREVLEGGKKKVTEVGAYLVGGHTIDDSSLKYGLAVTGEVHPEKVMTNSGIEEGDLLILTKPIGSGVIMSAQKAKICSPQIYQKALEEMKRANALGAKIMREFNVRGATDITGFGLTGHCYKMAKASNVKIVIYSDQVPLLEGAYDLADQGSIPSGAFRNLNFVLPHLDFKSRNGRPLDYNLKMIFNDPQTSGGLFFGAKPEKIEQVLGKLKDFGYEHAAVVGHAEKRNQDISGHGEHYLQFI